MTVGFSLADMTITKKALEVSADLTFFSLGALLYGPPTWRWIAVVSFAVWFCLSIIEAVS